MRTFLPGVLLLCGLNAAAQDTSHVYFTSGIGAIIPTGTFGDSYRRSLALNTGVEWQPGRHWVIQGNFEFNAVNYDQRLPDAGTNLLIRNTTSNVSLLGLGLGYDARFTPGGRFGLMPFAGAGWLRIGEPRLHPVAGSNVVDQQIFAHNDIYGRAGLRLTYRAKIKLLQTVFLEGAYWTSGATVQGGRPRATEILIGTRLGR